MQFSTQIKLGQEADITYASKIMMFGSCFSENIGMRLEKVKFNVSNNPLGILFNPCSILSTIQRIVARKPFTEEDIFCREGVWNSFHLHSRFARLSAEEYLRDANQQLAATHDFMRKATHIFITLGTAWVYELATDHTIVANCHKERSDLFLRRKLSVAECHQALSEMVRLVRTLQPTADITFTVSPIRHWKEGAHGNQLSKATLLLALEKLQAEDSSLRYFPAYEIVLDELRDYRYYANDLLHPNEVAIQYLWERFTEHRIAPDTQEEMNLVERLISAMNHRPFNPESESYQKFRKKTEELIAELEKKIPQIEWEKEKKNWGTN